MRNLAIAALLVASGCITEPGLFVEKTGDGNGRIVSDPAAIDCGEQCGALVTGPVTLTATPDASSTFIGWSGGGCTGTEPCLVDLASDTTITAQFAKTHVRLTVTPSPNGLVTSLQISCGDLCSAEYEAGLTVRLIASPALGYRFDGWGDGVTETPRMLTVSESMTLTPVFTRLAFLRVSVVGGRVTSDPAGVDTNQNNGASFAVGTVVTLHALGAGTLQWTGCTVDPSSNDCSVTIGEAGADVSALFN